MLKYKIEISKYIKFTKFQRCKIINYENISDKIFRLIKKMVVQKRKRK